MKLSKRIKNCKSLFVDKLIKYANRIITGILICFTFISVYIIICVGLRMLPTIGKVNDANAINAVLLNLSYSYVAGAIFYFFVSYLPFVQRQIWMRKYVLKKFKAIDAKLLSCVKCFVSLFNWGTISITEEGIKNIMKDKPVRTSNASYQALGIRETILEHLKGQREAIKRIADEIMDYKEYLSDEQLIFIKEIRDSRFFLLLNSFEIPKVDTPQNREELASALYELIMKYRNK